VKPGGRAGASMTCPGGHFAVIFKALAGGTSKDYSGREREGWFSALG